MLDLSILIPARNERFLARTVDDILANKRGRTEIIVVADGDWPDPPVKDHPDVQLIHHSISIGQRAAANEAARLSKAAYLMKVDAHCSFDEGFDVKMLNRMQPSWTAVPIMRNLHAFNWKCKRCGLSRYQGPPGPCTKCKRPTEMDIVWVGKNNPQSTSYCFDSEPHFQYNNEWKKTKIYKNMLAKEGITETMSLQGSCFMLFRDKWFELNICDEAWGSWGSQGIEVACKTWLSGGRVVVIHDTWYAHMFRTQGAGFGFPYPISGKQVEHAKKTAKSIFFFHKWPMQTRSLSWLLRKFWPVKGWSDAELREVSLRDGVVSPLSGSNSDNIVQKILSVSDFKTDSADSISSTIKSVGMTSGADDSFGFLGGNGVPSQNIDLVGNESQVFGVAARGISTDMVNDRNISTPPRQVLDSSIIIAKMHALVYYTDNRLDSNIMQACQRQLAKYANGRDLVSVSLKPIDFGRNIVMSGERGALTMFRQILAGVEAAQADIVWLVEHDVIYHPSHFDFTPGQKDLFYYNQNIWKVDAETGKALFYYARQTCCVCGYRDLFIEHYRKRVKMVEENGYSNKMGYEPGAPPGRVDHYGHSDRMSEFPNIDIRHSKNLTANRWSMDKFRRKPEGWLESDEVPGWGVTKNRFRELLNG